ncbi:MAG TPA: carbohydrate ABC transporter permease [Thermomicrobiales bacterium]|nr:carbohydrate ABC transporter permease [Thermomicrobiales bacterium]
MRRPGKGARWGGETVRAGLLLIYAVLSLYPLLWIVATSLRTSSGVYRAGLSLRVDEPRWQNYTDFFRAADVPRAAFVTLVVAAAVMALLFLTTSMTAYALARSDFPGRRLVLAALAGTIFVPAQTLLIPTFYVNRSLGLIGGWRSVAAVVLVMVAGGQAFNVYLLLGHFRTLPRDLYDAAALDGAGYFETYRRIALPLVRPGLATCALIAFAGIWNAYLVPLVYLGQQPGYQTLTIALVQYSRRFQTAYHLLAAGQVIALMPVVVAFVVLQRHCVRGLIGGALRG